MRDRSEVWCEASDINIHEIDKRANLAYARSGVATLVFISMDLYAILLKDIAPTSRYAANVGPTYGPSPQAVVRIMVSTGELHIVKVNKFRNFLLVGAQVDYDTFVAMGVDPVFWNDQEKAKVDKTFEDVVLGEDK